MTSSQGNSARTIATRGVVLHYDSWGLSFLRSIGPNGRRLAVWISLFFLFVFFIGFRHFQETLEYGFLSGRTDVNWSKAIAENFSNIFGFISIQFGQGLYGILGSNLTSMLVTSCLALAVAAVCIKVSRCARELRIDETGLCFCWFLNTKKVPWSSVKSVSVVNSRFGSQLEFACLEGADENKKKSFRLIIPLIKAKSESVSLRYFFENFLPQGVVSPRVLLELGCSEETRYTDIWWRSLRLSGRSATSKMAQGTKIASYEISEPITSSEFATVYLAKSNEGSTVVIKEYLIPQEMALIPELMERSAVLREKNVLSRISHESFPKLRESISEEGRELLVFDKIDGESLADKIKRDGVLEQSAVCEIGIQLCESLKILSATDGGIVHRDVTPPNILLSAGGKASLIDFNSAIYAKRGIDESFVGRPSYAPPEQIRAQASCRSDLYALARTLFFCLTGNEPEALTSLSELDWGGGISENLKLVLLRASELEEANRYRDAEEFGAALSKLAD